MESKVQRIIDQRIRPLLQAHEGDIELHHVAPEGVVRIKLAGACSACPGAQYTLTEIVKQEIKENCPEIKEVIALSGVSDTLLAEARRLLHRDRKKIG